MSGVNVRSMGALEIVARTIWGEARGQGVDTMTAVACVIMNRARRPRWWGADPVDVCLHPYQFSCWLPDDPNRAKLLAVTEADDQFLEAIQIAQRALCGVLTDPTGNADSYYAESSPAPDWTIGAAYTVTIGGMKFYRTELPAIATPASPPASHDDPPAIVAAAPIPIPTS